MSGTNVFPSSGNSLPSASALGKILAFLLLLSALSFSEPISACGYNFSQWVQSEAGLYIAIAITFTIAVITLAFIVGTVTNNANLLVFYKDELYHLFFSIAILLGFSSVFYFSCASFSYFMDTTFTTAFASAGVANICYTGFESPQTVATCYFSHLESQVRAYVTLALRSSINNEMDSTLVISFTNPVTGGVYLPFTAYKRTYSMQYEMLANTFAMPALVSISMQKILLGFSIDLVKWLLPIAFFLRILLPTRQMGNMLIALSLALYIIIPVFYAINGAMDQIVFNDCNSYDAAHPGLIQDAVMGGCGSGTSFWLVARALPQAFFLPNLTLALVVTFMSGISKALKVIG